MLNNIIERNIVFLQNHGVKINQDDKAIYQYGLQILYYYIIDLVVVLVPAYFLGRLYETILMTLIFALFQVFNGGYHAKTALKCLLTMAIGAAAGNILITLAAEKFVFGVAFTIIAGATIFIVPPVTNKRHPVSKKIAKRSKIIIRAGILFLLAAVMILSYFHKSVEVAVASVTLGLYLISLTAGKITNK